jgi:hypothetical protein
MKKLAQHRYGPVPPIQCLVVNQQNGFPGDGIGWFTGDAAKFKRSTPSQKRQIMKEMLLEIYQYAHWDAILKLFGMQPVNVIAPEVLRKEAQESVRRYGTGEGDAHREAKEYVAQHPELFGLPHGLRGEIEHPFPSADCLDVLFRDGSRWVGVEVKGPISDDLDIGRGLFQCVKYQALIEAEQKLLQTGVNAHMFLAVCRPLSPELAVRRSLLNISVLETSAGE